MLAILRKPLPLGKSRKPSKILSENTSNVSTFPRHSLPLAQSPLLFLHSRLSHLLPPTILNHPHHMHCHLLNHLRYLVLVPPQAPEDPPPFPLDVLLALAQPLQVQAFRLQYPFVSANNLFFDKSHAVSSPADPTTKLQQQIKSPVRPVANSRDSCIATMTEEAANAKKYLDSIHNQDNCATNDFEMCSYGFPSAYMRSS